MKLRGPAQFLALPLVTILKFKTLDLNTMKLHCQTTVFRVNLLICSMVPSPHPSHSIHSY